jgi:hypothetical protein
MLFITEVTSVPTVDLLPRLPVRLCLLVTKATSVIRIACYQGYECAFDHFFRLPVCLGLFFYQGYQCAYACLLPRLPVRPCLLVTKATSAPMLTGYQGYQCAFGCLLPSLPVCLLMLVTKVTSVPMVVCYQCYSRHNCVSLSGHL